MPLFYQHTINQTTKLGIWKIEESENFFLQNVPLQQNITHPHKRLQHLAGRFLLPFLFTDFPYSEILIANTRKPYLQNEQYHFSISHCGNYAAAIVSSTNRVGIDIEIPSEKILRVAHKFINASEEKFLENFSTQNLKIESQNAQLLSTVNHHPSTLLTIIWSAKESIFKWYSLGGVDFKEHMQLNNIIQQQNNSLLLSFIFKKDNSVQLNITAKMFDEIVLSWVVN